MGREHPFLDVVFNTTFAGMVGNAEFQRRRALSELKKLENRKDFPAFMRYVGQILDVFNTTTQELADHFSYDERDVRNCIAGKYGPHADLRGYVMSGTVNFFPGKIGA